MDFHDDYKRFAVDFGNLSAGEQRKILRMLDDEGSEDDGESEGEGEGGYEEDDDGASGSEE